jgi:hypothetical protein
VPVLLCLSVFVSVCLSLFLDTCIDAYVEVTGESKSEDLVLVLWRGRLQADHVDVVREIMEFYYRKRGRGLQVRSLLGAM